MTPDLLYDQMIGMGVREALVFSYGGNPGVGSLHRFRDAIENGWPRPLEIEEHCTRGWRTATRPARRGCRSRCCAATPAPTSWSTRGCADRVPVHRRAAGRGPGAQPDVAIVHAQEADREGNVSSGASPACRRRRCWRPARAGHGRADRRGARAATRRHGHPRLGDRRRGRGAGRLAALLQPRRHERDNDFYRFWDKLSRDRDEFPAWMQENVIAAVRASRTEPQ